MSSEQQNSGLIKTNTGLQRVNQQIAITNKLIDGIEADKNSPIVSTPSEDMKPRLTLDDLKRLPIRDQLRIMDKFLAGKKNEK